MSSRMAICLLRDVMSNAIIISKNILGGIKDTPSSISGWSLACRVHEIDFHRRQRMKIRVLQVHEEIASSRQVIELIVFQLQRYILPKNYGSFI